MNALLAFTLATSGTQLMKNTEEERRRGKGERQAGGSEKLRGQHILLLFSTPSLPV